MILESNLNLADQIVTGEKGKPSSATTEGSALALSIANAIREEVEADRLSKNVNLQMHWDFYHSFQEKYFVQRQYEDDVDFSKRKETGRVVNYVRFIVDLDTRFLYGRPNKIGRVYGGDKKTESRFSSINKLINIDNLQMEAKRKAAIFGEQGFRLIPVDKTTGSQIASDTAMSENVYPHPVPLDPRDTFFLYNPYNTVVAVVITSKVKDYKQDGKDIKITELITNDSRWLWHDDALQVSVKNKYSIREEFVLQQNNPERIDDIQDVIPLQTSLNECITDNVYFFARHGRPQLVSSVDLSGVIGKNNMVWEIKSDDEDTTDVLKKLGFLVWEGKMEAAADHVDNLEAKIFKVSSTAAISTGDLKGIGNLRSGAALITAHSPSIQKAQEQQIIWAKNEKEFAFAIASFDAKIHNTTVNKRFPDLDFAVLFPNESGVPGEELMNAEIRQIEFNSHLSTLEDLIMKANPKFTREQAIAYRTQIIEDSTEVTDAQRGFTSEQIESSGNGSSAKKSGEQTKSK